MALAEGAIAAGDNKSLLTLEPAFKKLQVRESRHCAVVGVTTERAPDVLLVFHVVSEQEELRGSIAERMDRFQKRCTELDPVTNQPRYGEQMRKKVGTVTSSRWHPRFQEEKVRSPQEFQFVNRVL